jgi:hypothetical protein
VVRGCFGGRILIEKVRIKIKDSYDKIFLLDMVRAQMAKEAEPSILGQ